MLSVGLRRIPCPTLDRRIERQVSFILESTTVKQLYISRIHRSDCSTGVGGVGDWFVVSNATPEDLNLSKFMVGNETMSSYFEFPDGYELPSGSEVKVWCQPGHRDFDAKYCLPPFLLWINSDGTMRSKPLFDAVNDTAILLDPFYTEVAAVDESKDQVTRYYCKCEPLLPSTGASTTCPSNTRGSRRRHGWYIFSRYWDSSRVSQKKGSPPTGIVESMSWTLGIPVLESFRVYTATMFLIHPILPLILMTELLDFLSRMMIKTKTPSRTRSSNNHSRSLLNRTSVLIDLYVGYVLLSTVHQLCTENTGTRLYQLMFVLEGIKTWCCICSTSIVTSRSSVVPRKCQELGYRYATWIRVVSLGKELHIILAFVLMKTEELEPYNWPLDVLTFDITSILLFLYVLATPCCIASILLSVMQTLVALWSLLNAAVLS